MAPVSASLLQTSGRQHAPIAISIVHGTKALPEAQRPPRPRPQSATYRRPVRPQSATYGHPVASACGPVGVTGQRWAGSATCGVEARKHKRPPARPVASPLAPGARSRPASARSGKLCRASGGSGGAFGKTVVMVSRPQSASRGRFSRQTSADPRHVATSACGADDCTEYLDVGAGDDGMCGYSSTIAGVDPSVVAAAVTASDDESACAQGQTDLSASMTRLRLNLRGYLPQLPAMPPASPLHSRRASACSSREETPAQSPKNGPMRERSETGSTMPWTVQPRVDEDEVQMHVAPASFAVALASVAVDVACHSEGWPLDPVAWMTRVLSDTQDTVGLLDGRASAVRAHVSEGALPHAEVLAWSRVIRAIERKRDLLYELVRLTAVYEAAVASRSELLLSAAASETASVGNLASEASALVPYLRRCVQDVVPKAAAENGEALLLFFRLPPHHAAVQYAGGLLRQEGEQWASAALQLAFAVAVEESLKIAEPEQPWLAIERMVDLAVVLGASRDHSIIRKANAVAESARERAQVKAQAEAEAAAEERPAGRPRVVRPRSAVSASRPPVQRPLSAASAEGRRRSPSKCAVPAARLPMEAMYALASELRVGHALAT
eukprot:TRINITY_DN24929_c0_g6_i1.p1 TRINITY_DN24929_c0_g6~~TRINITY_DN24929_c0_g6_i1.p1  ORF type:complete len:612 (+),score=84.29 TRINITY_DN24929_c0_g6_i1:42-1877(+)